MRTPNKSTAKTAAVMNLISRRPDGANPALGRSISISREQIEYIDIGLLDDDPMNFYDLSKIDELAANIELLGLQQPLRVRPAYEPGRYIIVSGHRRRAAVWRLVEDGHRELSSIPCIVDRDQVPVALQELRLIYANSDTRIMTSAEIARQAERVEELLYQLKEGGYEFPGRMRDHVAEACKVSKSKLSRLRVIRENLDAQWRPIYEAGKLAEATAYALAQMPRERQQIICNGLANRGDAPSLVQTYQVQNYGERLAQAEAVECTSYGHGPCLNREAMQERIMQGDSLLYNYCRQCCADCPELTKCKYACPMLEERVKALKEDAKARRQQERDAKAAVEQQAVEQIKALWRRFGKIRAAAGKSMEECFEAVFYPDNEAMRERHKNYERQNETFTSETMLPYGFGLFIGEIWRLINLADLLGVSLDYLLCRTDTPEGPAPAQPEGQLVLNGWMPGGTLPSTDCDVVADFEVGFGKTVREFCKFSSGKFFWASSGKAIDLSVVRWMALPPVEDAPKLVPELGTGEAVGVEQNRDLH